MTLFIHTKGRCNFQFVSIPKDKAEQLKEAGAIKGNNLEVPNDEIYQAYLKTFGGKQ